MNTKHIISAALLAAASASTFAASLGNEFTEMPQAQSTMTRAQVQAETRAAMAHGSLERSSYDEQESVVLAHQGHDVAPTRAQVRAETQAYFVAHPNARSESSTYGVGVNVRS